MSVSTQGSPSIGGVGLLGGDDGAVDVEVVASCATEAGH